MFGMLAADKTELRIITYEPDILSNCSAMLWAVIVGILIIIWLHKINKTYYVLAFFAKRVKTSDGTPVDEIAPTVKQRTIFGNAFDIFGLTSSQLFAHMRDKALEMQKSYLEYTFTMPVYNIIRAEDAEFVLNNQNFLTKGLAYTFFHPFLRNGLLISADKKWHTRRKMLTPAFHFNILEQFEEVFKKESHKFIERLANMNNVELYLKEAISKFTLNIVCETALGVTLDDRLNGADYRASFKMIEDSFVKRISNPLYISDTLFNFFAGAQYKPHYKIVHDFSSEIIQKRREIFKQQLTKTNEAINEEEEATFMKKQRYAMLDTLLLAEKNGLIDHIGICEEVDTFMFAGFDTTSMSLAFGLMNLSIYPEFQERCYQEIKENVDDDLSKLDIGQLNKLKYLDCCIKEILRLYPSAPTIVRQATQDTTLDNKLILPKRTQLSIHIFDIHRDPKYFPDPNKFDPERFMPENSIGRHPYAYIPFSAGPRNCMGQKFAMLEMKTFLVYILKNFQLLPMVDPAEIEFEAGIVIRTKDDIPVKLIKRL